MVRGSDFELVLREAKTADGEVWLRVVGEPRADEVQRLIEAVPSLAQEKEGQERQVVLDLSEVSYCSRDAAFTL
ncbi:hypothetical protein GCM10010358_73470 [Streptomyces minutiscleroticus]|uniref:STAS domain-containing protein n=2 Tax=Streptomyces minutiscleroticus TaxID=68238 RepID=A0A918P0F2_9ACTN|nr:hypothetical protein GCM10010358_73470 [Streptomyces minutiscleroticus]